MYYNLRIVYVTTPDKTTAKNLSHKILQNRLAGCINLIDGMESMYWWKGKITEGKECILLVKTHYSNMKQLTKLVEKYNSYDCPCVIPSRNKRTVIKSPSSYSRIKAKACI